MCNAVETYHACGHFHASNLIPCSAAAATQADHPPPKPAKYDLPTECAACATMSAEERASSQNRWEVFQRKDAAQSKYIEQLEAAMAETIRAINRGAYHANGGVELEFSER